MISKAIQNDSNEIIAIWQIIIWRMDVHRITPQKLAEITGYSLAFILKGVKGEAALITDTFLRNCVSAFGLIEGRIDGIDNTNISEHLTREQCIELLKPKPAMPPDKKHFWENDDSID